MVVVTEVGNGQIPSQQCQHHKRPLASWSVFHSFIALCLFRSDSNSHLKCHPLRIIFFCAQKFFPESTIPSQRFESMVSQRSVPCGLFLCSVG